jgi:hypothetical protein
MIRSRNKLDAYYTNSKLVEQLLIKYPVSTNKVILEPCNGKGYISHYLKQEYSVVTNDIDPNTNSTYLYDFTDKSVVNIFKRHCDIVITNPPFNVAEQILANSLEVADEVIMLLRLSFIEPCKSRRDLLNAYKDNLVKVIPISPRPKFRDDTTGSDSVTVAWFIWNKNYSWKQLSIDCPFDFITDWK